MTGRGDVSDVPVLASLSGHADENAVEVALLDFSGVIVHTNPAWDDFCRDNMGDPALAGVGVSYLEACDAAADEPGAAAVAKAIRIALLGGLPAPLSMLVPCDSPAVPRVFDTLVSSRLDDSGTCVGATVTLSRVLGDGREIQGFPRSSTGSSRQAWAPDLMPALLRVAEVVADEETLQQTLRRLAEAARALLNVSYAAVGISGPAGRLDEFAHAGIDPQTLQGLSSPSAVVQWFRQRPHFLSRDVMLTGRKLATLYVADGISARISPDIGRLADGFVEAVGTAIENARLHQVAQRGHRWAEAAAELTQELVSRGDRAPLDVVLARAAAAAEADLAVIMVQGDEHTIRLQGIVGGRPEIVPGRVFSRKGSAAAEVIRTGKPLLLERPPPQIDEVSGRPMGPVAVVPLTSGRTVLGGLVVSRFEERPAFTPTDVDALSRFSNYAGIALELDQAIADRQQLRLHDDRTRIAVDLHEGVVRQLFAVGMGLESLIGSLPDSQLRHRVSDYVTAIDETIRGIREAIYRMADD